MGGKSKQEKQANAVSEAQLAQGAAVLGGLETPSLEALTAKLQRAVYLGDIKPIEAITILQKQTAMRNIKIDPRLEMQQFESLDQLNKQAMQMGLAPADIAALYDVGANEHTAQKTKRQSIDKAAAERGITGSGLAQQADAEGLQGAYEPGVDSRLDVARAAGEKRLASGVAGAEQAGGIRMQSFGERADIASAKDAINKFNVDATNLTRLNNAEDARKVALRNAVERQRINVENTGISNQEEKMRAGSVQQEFQNRLDKATSIADLYKQGGLGQMQNQQRGTDIGGAVAGAGAQVFSEYGPGAWQKYLDRNKPAPDAPKYGRNIIGGSAYL